MSNKLRGKLLVGQSGGCTAVMNASLVGIVEEARRHPEIVATYGAIDGIHGLLEENLVDLGRVRPRTLATLRRTPAAALGSCRYRLSEEEGARALSVLRARDIRYLLYIGGNDSADTSHRLAQMAQSLGYELKVVVVPKTIDNDLELTDHCPGYGSVARFVALATRDAGRDTEAMRRVDPVKIVEVMGRNAGWIAAATALGKRSPWDAPHLIYVPERPWEAERFLAEVEGVVRRLGYAVVVVAETVRDAAGRPVAEEGPPDPFGHPRLGGAAHRLCQIVAGHLKLGARWDKPGTIQRMSMVAASQVDLAEAYLVGKKAVEYALAGYTDRMVTLVREAGEPYRCTTGLAPLSDIAHRERRLPPEFRDDAASFITPAFMDYARPLIGGPLPRYGRLRPYPVPRLCPQGP